MSTDENYRRERAAYLRSLDAAYSIDPPEEASMSDIVRYRVIKPSSLPMRCPLVSSIVYWLLLDRLGAPGWLYVIVAVLMAFVWLAWAVGGWVNQSVDAPGFGKIEHLL